MRIVKLEDIDLLSTNAPGSTYDEYASGTSYTTGDFVKVSFESDGTTPLEPVHEFEALDSTNGDYPPDNPTKWKDLGASNPYRAFDEFMSTETVRDDGADMVIEIDTSGTDAIGIFGIYAAKVTLKLISGGETIKTETFDIRKPILYSGWYYWLFTPYSYNDSTIILWTYPRQASSSVEITSEPRVGRCAATHIVAGNTETLGSTQYGVAAGIDDYSIKDVDEQGRTYLNQGAYAKRVDMSMWLNNDDFDSVNAQLTAIRGTKAIFDCNNLEKSDYNALVVLGYYRNFDTLIPSYALSKCNIEIAGLT